MARTTVCALHFDDSRSRSASSATLELSKYVLSDQQPSKAQ